MIKVEIINIIKNNYYYVLPQMKYSDWDSLSTKFKYFLSELPINEYREKYQKIKTVEFDLSGKYKCFLYL
jgi:hypothetical protein